MDKIWFLLYNLIGVPAQYTMYQIARFFHEKVAEGIAGRKGETALLRDSLAHVDSDKPRILIHCASAGEWEQARPVINALKQANPSVYVIIMFFSSSGFNFVNNNDEFDLKVYMPFDSYFRARKFFKEINPSLWITVKHDIWPNHMFAAGNLNIPAVLIDASLPISSRRHFWLFTYFNRAVYKNFQYIFPVSEQDKSRFLILYPYPDKMLICGDTRFEQVYKRGVSARNMEAFRLFDSDKGPVLIAGSIWPSDEKHLLPAVSRLMHEYSDLNVILVPHEPARSHMRKLEEFLDSESIQSKRFGAIVETGHNDTRLALVDTVGILAQLYAQTDIAYVGGSFGPGVHNVMEPAVQGKPVIFGPRHLNSLEARQLVERRGGFAVSNSDDIVSIVSEFLNNSGRRTEAGQKARELVEDNLGATEKIVNELKKTYDFINA
ncbi:3-deoxy-D-manno-octulosonic acid transferase [candidate division KSB1 bacterium]